MEYESKRKIKRLKKKKRKLLIIELIFLATMVYSGIQIVIWFIENNTTNQIMKEISSSITIDNNKPDNDINKYEINFKELKEKNKNTVGWLKVQGTDIEYPVVQGQDNDYYLNHNFYNDYSKAGWAFADFRNKFDGSDKNIIIYGHNRRDGSMFQSLKNVLEDEWFNDKSNRIIIFFTEKEKSFYDVFSVYKIEAEDYYTQTFFNSQTDYEEFLKSIKNRSTKNFGTDISSNDKILTLSTCDDDSNYRVVLHAKKIE